MRTTGRAVFFPGEDAKPRRTPVALQDAGAV
jgi:hypothetical protein